MVVSVPALSRGSGTYQALAPILGTIFGALIILHMPIVF